MRFYSPHENLWLMGGPKGTVRFMGGGYVTDDPDEIAWLRSHSGFGVDFFAEGEPQRPKPAGEPAAAAQRPVRGGHRS